MNKPSSWGRGLHVVVYQSWRPVRVGVVAVPPLHEIGDHVLGVVTLLGEEVLEPRGPLLIPAPLQDAVLDEVGEASGQGAAYDPEARDEVVEPRHPEEGVPQHQQGPALAHHLPGSG
jgi:hypothetical protein